jgi:NADPH:quinone reductase-like Zn-dependent oxidoreductase
MHYHRILITRTGGPEVLQVVEEELRPPAAGEARLRVLAAAVSRPDITVRQGRSLYSGTPLGQKLPFTPGYAVIGEVDAVGEGVSGVKTGQRVGALTVIGGYSEYVYWKAERLIPLPNGLDPAEAVTLVLNYLVAYQAMHRSAKVKAGEAALIIGASGGIGTALLQLGRLAGLRMYGLASQGKHPQLAEYGAMLIDYATQDFVEVIRRGEPDGLHVVFDGMSGEYLPRGLAVLGKGGRLVSFGEPSGGLPALLRMLGTVLKTNLKPGGKRIKLYGTSTYFLGNRQPYIEDWGTLFELLRERKIQPVIYRRLPLLEAAQANALMESGQVVGNVVLVAGDAPG